MSGYNQRQQPNRKPTEWGTDIYSLSDKLQESFKVFGGGRRHRFWSKRTISSHGISLLSLLRVLSQIDIIILLSILLGTLTTWMCLHYEYFWNVQVALVVSPIVFPLAFSINESYRRREKVLEDLGAYYAASAELYWLQREWAAASGFDDDHVKGVRITLGTLLAHMIHYTSADTTHEKRGQKLGAIYRELSSLSERIEVLRLGKMPANSPLVSRIIHYHHLMVLSFERVRTVKEYRTPRSIRSFCKIMVVILPVLLSPYFAYLARKAAMDLHPFKDRTEKSVDFNQDWSAYMTSVITSVVFGVLQSVQDSLDDPFDGISEDDIDLHLVAAWHPTALWETCKDQRIPVLESVSDSCQCMRRRKAVVTQKKPDETMEEADIPDIPTLLNPNVIARQASMGAIPTARRSSLHNPTSPKTSISSAPSRIETQESSSYLNESEV
eukprot:m.125117 g.125117  ORF g.125117 m.125117 type:complete len:440 (+) comp14488_c0_seq6:135-1454(+)